MALQIRRGTDAQRQTIRFNSGELVYTTDYKDFFVGDGSTNGGVRIAPIKSINGLQGDATEGALTLTTDQIDEGSTNLYYSSQQARIDAGAALVGGNVGNTGISFTYHSNDDTITAVVTAGGYSLPIASPTELGGVKISLGGLSIDGAGLLSVTTPVTAGTAGQIPYYTGTNSVGTAGTKLTWKQSGDTYPTGGQLTVLGVVEANRVELAKDLADGGFFIATQADQNANNEVFAIRSAHSSASLPTSARFFHSRGTIASPATIQTGDDIFALQFVGLTAPGGAISAQIKATATGTVSSNQVPGILTLSAGGNSGDLIDAIAIKYDQVNFTVRATFPDGTAGDPSIAFTTDGGIDSGFFHPGDGIICTSINAVEKVRVDSGGMRVEGFMKVGGFTTTALPDPAEAGMIVLDTTTNQFKGYNGSAWVVLG